MSDCTVRPKLRPCPFCGRNAYVHEHYSFPGQTPKDYPNNKPIGYAVGCRTFDCRGKRENTGFMYDTEAEAIEAWNTRAERTTTMTTDEGSQYWYSCDTCDCDGYAQVVPNYCPNCGARVEKVDA